MSHIVGIETRIYKLANNSTKGSKEDITLARELADLDEQVDLNSKGNYEKTNELFKRASR